MVKNPNGNNAMIVGVVGGGPGTGCGTRPTPTVFTRVTSFIGWIKKHMLTRLRWNGFVQLLERSDGVFFFDQNQGNSADPGGPLIVRENDTPIIYGWFFYKLTESFCQYHDLSICT